MSNDTTSTPKLWVLDTVGMLTTRPVCISKIIYVPSAAADDILFKQWNDESTIATGCKVGETATITGNDTITGSGTALPSTIVDGSVFEIIQSSGLAVNKGVKALVKTAGNDTVVVIWDDKWTNEGPVVYTWRTFGTTTALVLKAGASDASPIHLDFGEKGRWFQNLCLETLDGGVVYVYLL